VQPSLPGRGSPNTMIDSLFIISSSGNYVVERHFKGTIPRMVCEPFMEKLRGSDRIEEIPGMICSNRRHALLHILRENMVLLAVVTQEESPLVIFELLDRVHQVLQRYLGEVNEDTLRANFSTVYLLLSEMIDSGLPSTMELNSLESIIAPPSAIGKVVQAVSGSRSQVLSDVPPEANGQSSTLDAITTALGAGTHTQIGGASAEVWWRRQNVVYASNEIYVDIVEWVDCIVNEAGHIVSGESTVKFRSTASSVGFLKCGSLCAIPTWYVMCPSIHAYVFNDMSVTTRCLSFRQMVNLRLPRIGFPTRLSACRFTSKCPYATMQNMAD